MKYRFTALVLAVILGYLFSAWLFGQDNQRVEIIKVRDGILSIFDYSGAKILHIEGLPQQNKWFTLPKEHPALFGDIKVILTTKEGTLFKAKWELVQ